MGNPGVSTKEKRKAIFKILEERGLDQKIGKNKKARRAIVDAVDQAGLHIRGKGWSNRYEIEEFLTEMLDNPQKEDLLEKRYIFEIVKGSLRITFLPKEIKMQEESYFESKQTFSIDEETGMLILEDEGFHLTRRKGESVLFRQIERYNRHGLKMYYEISKQDFDLQSTGRLKEDIEACHNGEYSVKNEVNTEIIERSPNLIKGKSRKIRNTTKKGFVLGKGNLNEAIIKEKKEEEEEEGLLKVESYSDEVLEVDIGTSVIEDKSKIELYREWVQISAAFANTILKLAKTDPEWKKIVDEIGLVKTSRKDREILGIDINGGVTIADLREVYRNSSYNSYNSARICAVIGIARKNEINIRE